jgi:hypothetical protein
MQHFQKFIVQTFAIIHFSHYQSSQYLNERIFPDAKRCAANRDVLDTK